MVPTTTAQWTIRAKDGLDGLKLDRHAPIQPLGPMACLVKIAAVSLNYRDVAIPTGKYPLYFNDSIVPTSDGAGTVVAVGDNVRLHRIGDKVCTLFNQGHQSGRVTPAIRKTTLGSAVDGPLRHYAVYEETGLVPAPKTLSLLEAAALPCAAVTAWNALYGLSDRAVQRGDVVLTQGTGGVSLFAAQIAISAGATVIATTSSDRKAEQLEKLGVHHIINYKTNPNWGETAKQLAAGEGVDHIIEVGGETTIAQSLIAIRSEGVISMIGFLGGLDKPKDASQQHGFGDFFRAVAIMRSVFIGSKEQFVAMNKFIDENDIKPVVDKNIFGFEQAREAYEYLLEQGHFGKVVIRVSD